MTQDIKKVAVTADAAILRRYAATAPLGVPMDNLRWRLQRRLCWSLDRTVDALVEALARGFVELAELPHTDENQGTLVVRSVWRN